MQSHKKEPEIEGIDLRPLERCEISTLKTFFVKINENFKQRIYYRPTKIRKKACIISYTECVYALCRCIAFYPPTASAKKYPVSSVSTFGPEKDKGTDVPYLPSSYLRLLLQQKNTWDINPYIDRVYLTK